MAEYRLKQQHEFFLSGRVNHLISSSVNHAFPLLKIKLKDQQTIQTNDSLAQMGETSLSGDVYIHEFQVLESLLAGFSQC